MVNVTATHPAQIFVRFTYTIGLLFEVTGLESFNASQARVRNGRRSLRLEMHIAAFRHPKLARLFCLSGHLCSALLVLGFVGLAYYAQA